MATTSRIPVQKRIALRQMEIEALELAALGHTQQEIGQQIGRCRSAVGALLRRVDAKLVDQLQDTGAEIKARQTHHLEVVYREAMRAWRRSQLDGKQKKETVSTGDNKVERTTRGQYGDPRFLDQARGALADVRTIWGLDEATTRQRDGGPVSIQVAFVDGREVFGHGHEAGGPPTIDASTISTMPAENHISESDVMADTQDGTSEPVEEVM